MKTQYLIGARALIDNVLNELEQDELTVGNRTKVTERITKAHDAVATIATMGNKFPITKFNLMSELASITEQLTEIQELMENGR